MPKNKDGKIVLLDPFVGSGTALIEASLIGIDSIGIDIDDLSCEISRTKIDVLAKSTPDELQDAAVQAKAYCSPLFQLGAKENGYSFPPWIARKFQRWQSPEEQKQYETEISQWLRAISEIKSDVGRHAVRICLSDAISRKFNIRMLGTGVGRFALEIGETKLSNIINSNLDSLVRAAFICRTIKQEYVLNIGRAEVIKNTATAMPLPDESISVILTSPPYLPASSGRENYLIGKSISITALGLMTAKEIQELEARSVGSMKSNGDSDLDGLPTEIGKLFKWLKADELRAIKARPTVAYYKDLKKALKETYRVLLPGGIAIYVIGKESVFYKFSSRKVLYRVPCDEIFRKIAESCGFIVEERVDVELDKKNSNARPRSLDTFFETVFLLRKPHQDYHPPHHL